ncbi:uncharacterized protein A4U43_C08F14930 [Asparagus officinalis]|uniref:uncharacterized protein LOC109822851 n=1 Tax=Asparagus officinalis TaxID=4686 RepID=UPI00098E2182|nr:uncharacterized protein LOC109822851 [Asparagus officinalis]ONK60152.1 uncharacterized protein A4U43_C08F14930 [Asparagus officinalis]
MGICSSCEATSIIETPTAKLALTDGSLQEYDRPVKASHVLRQKDEFVCDSDEMEFDGFMSAMDSNEYLQMGQLYFLLPRSMLKRPLHAEEMAALAVKASSALMRARSYHFGSSLAVAPVVDFPTIQPRNNITTEAEHTTVAAMAKRRRRRRSGSGGSGRSFASSLGSIMEEIVEE